MFSTQFFLFIAFFTGRELCDAQIVKKGLLICDLVALQAPFFVIIGCFFPFFFPWNFSRCFPAGGSLRSMNEAFESRDSRERALRFSIVSGRWRHTGGQPPSFQSRRVSVASAVRQRDAGG